ncbi:MAG: hypothetical protein GQ559_07315 [Desulfobulbaceae bacterium]|nr:hypothetical protein [Desulfobulbaceae bacterium]
MAQQTAHNLDIYFSGTIDKKLKEARELYVRYGSRLLAHQDIRSHLENLDQFSSLLSRQMLSMGMDRLCTACAGRDGGGCCSAYMANNTDAILLLINLLLHVEVDKQHNNDVECCFLGKAGCTLPIKPIFCLNYNCSRIQDAATAAEIKILDKAAGKLLSEQIEMERTLLSYFRMKKL